MNEIKRLFIERISSGLKRKSITTASRWAESYRVMGNPFPGPWNFKHHPWLREMHDSTAEFNYAQKSAQMGVSETMLNITFFAVDVKGVDVLYVLPAQTPHASDFSSGRFDPALELSPHLNKLFSDVKNIGHKRAGSTNLYIRGSKSRAGLKSIPVGIILMDEMDEMDLENIPLVLERTAGQIEKQIWGVSTPTIDNVGINQYFLESTQEHFNFKCPHCSKRTELIYPDSLVITAEDIHDPTLKDSHYICKECKKKLDQETKTEWLKDGIWVPNHTDRESRGFYINQMYSCTIKPTDLAKAKLNAQHDPAAEQEFYNSKLGLPHVVDGARVTDSDITSCIGSHKRGSLARGLVTMGVDVGKWIHYEINTWKLNHFYDTVDINAQAQCLQLTHGRCEHFEELDILMKQYNIAMCVIDANPERRKAYEFTQRFPGHVKMCFYGRGITGKQIHESKDVEPTVTVDRTSWLDMSLSRFRQRSISIPVDTTEEYKSHIKAPVRIYKHDSDKNPVGKYVNGNDADHYAHARNYSEIALPLAANLAVSYDIRGV